MKTTTLSRLLHIHSPLFVTLLAVALCTSVVCAHFTVNPRESCRIDFVIESSEAVDFDLYYDVGRGLNEKDHQTKFIYTINRPTHVSFCIPMFSQLRTLRFDPAASPLQMTIRSITLTYSSGEQFEVEARHLLPNEQIMNFSSKDGAFYFETTKDANDPYFTFAQLQQNSVQPNGFTVYTHYLLWVVSALLLVYGARFLYFYFFIPGSFLAA